MNRLLFFIPVLLVCSCKPQSDKEDTKINKIPNFESICTCDNELDVIKDSVYDKTYVMFFSPECEMCEDEIRTIIENKNKCTNHRFIFITQPIMKNEVPLFLETVPMNEISNSAILYDNSLKYHTLFGVTAPPALFIYDKKGRLIKSHHGYTHMELILK